MDIYGYPGIIRYTIIITQPIEFQGMKIGSPEQDGGKFIESYKVDHRPDENANGYVGESIKQHITLCSSIKH